MGRYVVRIFEHVVRYQQTWTCKCRSEKQPFLSDQANTAKVIKSIQYSLKPTSPVALAETGADVYFLISPPALNDRRKSAPVNAIAKKDLGGTSRRTKSVIPSGDLQSAFMTPRASSSMQEESPLSTLRVGALAHLYRHEAKSAFKLFPSIHIGPCLTVHSQRD